MRKINAIVSKLLDWYPKNARDLPWRHTNDPYALAVAEIMLQQTQVKTVLPYWERWMRELPTIQAVAKARSETIHKLWEGLGYYTRARNLQKAARQIMKQHDGKFPDNFDDVLALPGIGRYTAGAICSIAFNQPTPILDGNVIRVLTRVFGIGENPRKKKTNARLWQLAEELVTHANKVAQASCLQKQAGSLFHSKNSRSALNQSLMELGALICTPRQPQCPVCPVKKLCVAFRENRVAELPNLGRRTATTARRFIAFVIERNGKYFVRQRPAGVVNAHLWEFPNVEIGARLFEPQHARLQNAAGKIPATDGTRTRCGSGAPRSKSVADVAAQLFGSSPTSINHLCTVKHSITRYRITLEARRVSFGGRSSPTPKIFGARSPSSAVALLRRVEARSSENNGVWLTPARLRKLAFTAAHKTILNQLQSSADDAGGTRLRRVVSGVAPETIGNQRLQLLV